MACEIFPRAARCAVGAGDCRSRGDGARVHLAERRGDSRSSRVFRGTIGLRRAVCGERCAVCFAAPSSPRCPRSRRAAFGSRAGARARLGAAERRGAPGELDGWTGEAPSPACAGGRGRLSALRARRAGCPSFRAAASALAVGTSRSRPDAAADLGDRASGDAFRVRVRCRGRAGDRSPPRILQDAFRGSRLGAWHGRCRRRTKGPRFRVCPFYEKRQNMLDAGAPGSFSAKSDLGVSPQVRMTPFPLTS